MIYHSNNGLDDRLLAFLGLDKRINACCIICPLSILLHCCQYIIQYQFISYSLDTQYQKSTYIKNKFLLTFGSSTLNENSISLLLLKIDLKMPRNYDWYLSLKKSPLNPPKWVFPIAWTILYTLIGLSFVSFIQTTGFVITDGLLFFMVQMMANFAWSPFFFWKKMISAALIDIIVMWIFILLTIIQFQKVNPTSAYLLYPYLVWVSFATYLNGYIVVKNKDFDRNDYKKQ